jgi:hypothetical protein
MLFRVWHVNPFDPALVAVGRNWLAIPNVEMSKQSRFPRTFTAERHRSMPGISLSHSGPFLVGFTGHRRVENEEKVAPVLREVLASLRRDLGGEMIGRSSIASGGDTLFAEACLAASIKWVALLPFPEAEFKKDFNDADWDRARFLLERAQRIEVLSETAERPDGYLQCGLATVDGTDLMVALWDGQASRGPGGTAQIVEHARLVQKPLVIISSPGLEVTRERFQ